MTSKSRSRILALLLTVLTPSLGHIYSGRFGRGVVFLLAIFLIAYGGLFAGLISSFNGLLIWLILVISWWLFILIDSWKTAKKVSPIEIRWYNRWYYYILWFVLIQWGIPYILPNTKNYYEAFKAPSVSSVPTLLPGDHFMVDKQYYLNHPLKRGDLIVFKPEDDPNSDIDESAGSSIKRLIAISGDKIALKDKTVFINGEAMQEPYAIWEKGGLSEGEFPEMILPPHTIFVLGDNRDNSRDSRFYKNPFIREENIIGKALYIYWTRESYSRIGTPL